MTDTEIRKAVRFTLEEMGYAPRCEEEWISQSLALRLLKRVNIGRAKLERLYEKKIVKFKKDDNDIRNSSVSVNREDIYKLLNQ